MKNRNFAIKDETHTRLKLLSVRLGKPLGETIEHLLNTHEHLEDLGPAGFRGGLAARGQAAFVRRGRVR